jgi:hypothetical protein
MTDSTEGPLAFEEFFERAHGPMGGLYYRPNDTVQAATARLMRVCGDYMNYLRGFSVPGAEQP